MTAKATTATKTLVRAKKSNRVITSATLSDVAPAAAGWVFSPSFVYRVVDGGHRRILRDLGVTRALGASTSVAEMWELVYAQMLEDYRIEYVYKNELIHRLVLEQHDPGTATIVLEKPIGGFASRVDLLIVNGTTTAYEVKTDHDRLDRLERQTMESLRVFDRVAVVCSDRHLDAVREKVDDRVGIVRMRPTGAFSTVRRARPNAGSVDPTAIFAILRLEERLEIVGRRFGCVPRMRPADRDRYCFERFVCLKPRAAHGELRDALASRFENGKKSPEGLPRAIAHLYYKLTAGERRMLTSPGVLTRPIG